ncbi:unnamed protein product [Ascophyllum nodosum]
MLDPHDMADLIHGTTRDHKKAVPHPQRFWAREGLHMDSIHFRQCSVACVRRSTSRFIKRLGQQGGCELKEAAVRVLTHVNVWPYSCIGWDIPLGRVKQRFYLACPWARSTTLRYQLRSA